MNNLEKKKKKKKKRPNQFCLSPSLPSVEKESLEIEMEYIFPALPNVS